MKIPIAISARHIHLSPEHLAKLFGPGYQLQPAKDLVQKGEFASQETVILSGPKGRIEEVRIVGPLRKQTQIEVTKTDARRLGINPPVRPSGDLAGSAGLQVQGPQRMINLTEGVIVAKRHIHLAPEEAKSLKLVDNQEVSVKVESERSVTFHKVTVRVSDRYRLQMHLDPDEANAAAIAGEAEGEIIN